MSDIIRFPRAFVQGESVVLESRSLEILVDVKEGLNPRSLTDKLSGIRYADSDYVYQLNSEIKGKPEYLGFESYNLDDGSLEVVFAGTLGPVVINHRFTLPKERSFFEEQISIKNTANFPIVASSLYFGFTREFNTQEENIERYRFIAIPFKHQLMYPDYKPESTVRLMVPDYKESAMSEKEYEEYTVKELFERKGGYRLTWNKPKIYTSEFGSEGWIWMDLINNISLLIVKYSQDGIEFSLIKPEKKGENHYVHFGGSGTWHEDPEKALILDPNKEVVFGVSHYEILEGDWKKAYYSFRSYMEDKGHKIPLHFDPPIHWNELYDNKLWWVGDTLENRKKFYSLPQIEEEAKKAWEIGAEAIYLDPGWDTTMGSTVWAKDRLLECKEFVKLMQSNYNLKVSLHTPLAAWNDVDAYPVEARKRDKEGNTLDALCSGSPAYLEAKTKRLLNLAEAGIVYFMFDGTWFTGRCYDENHGHSIPYTREEHCRSILKLIQNVHKKFPNVLIELHDPVVSGVPIRYVPIYYLHGEPHSFDEIWAFEYMWDPLDDLLSGRAKSLYYYNLAHSLPLYIHIDLREDNEYALVFWWYASTCRHLGVGGKHPNGKVWEAHKQAMRDYKRLKQFYTQGVFYGLDETIHVHTLSDRNASVVNIFNLTENMVSREVEFELSEIGFPEDVRVSVSDIKYLQEGSTLSFEVYLPPLGVKVVEIRGDKA